MLGKINLIHYFVLSRQITVKCSQFYCNWKLNIMGSAKTIKDFGYVFNLEGRLRKLNENGQASNEPFQFNVSNNHHECQRHYEELGDAINEHIYQLLEHEEKLLRLPVPKDLEPENSSFIFVSKDYNQKSNLLILIHGSGVVKAGQWARSLIINDNINSGSQIPYIRKAIERDFGVIVMNTNDNFKDNNLKIPKSSNPEQHAVYVWENYVTNTKATSIAVVAHSYGGVVTLTLVHKFQEDFEQRVKAIAFTDSVHRFSNLKVTNMLKQVSRNWVSSADPLDTPQKYPDHDIAKVSAGHIKHEMTSHSSIESVFKFIDERMPSN